MKRVVSLLMSVVMLLSFAMGMNLTVLADDGKTIKSATLTLAKPYTVYEGNYAGYSEGTDDKGNPYREYLYLALDFNAGDVVDITFSDGTTDKYTYYVGDSKDGGWYNSDDEKIYIYSHDFTIDTADGLGTAYASYGIMDSNYNDYGYDIEDVPVEIIENPVKSFSLAPVNSYKIYEKAHGYYDDEKYWHYDAPDFNEGDKITVNYTNRTETYTYKKDYSEYGYSLKFLNDNNDDEILDVDSYSFDLDGTGKTTFEVKLIDYGRTIDVPVEIVENPIDTFSFVPIKGSCTVTEGDYFGGSVDFDNDGNPYEIYFYRVEFNEGDKITVKYTDKTSEEFVYKKGEIWDFVNDKSEVLNVYSRQFRDNGLGETSFKLELTDYGKTINVPVTVVAKSSGGSTSGGSTSGGGAAPAPTTDDSQKTEEQKPSTSTATTTATATQKPATVKVSKTTAKKNGVVVTWKTAKDVTGYEIQLATDKKFKKNKKTVKVNKKNASKKTVKKLKSKKKYYVRVRSYKIVNGKKVYGKWSKIKTVKTK